MGGSKTAVRRPRGRGGRGVGWGILAVTIFGLICAFVIMQETFAQRHWRGLVRRGDTWAIKSLVEAEIERWRGMRVPKGTNAGLWHGVQAAEVASVGRDYINLIASAEGEYHIVDGHRREVSSPLNEGMNLRAALLERVFYDIPNVRLSLVRVDVYTTYRAEDGTPEQRCILTATADRATADPLPWDDLRPSEILARFDARYKLAASGAALPIDPGPVLTDEHEDGAARAEPDDGRQAVDAVERLLAARQQRDDGDEQSGS